MDKASQDYEQFVIHLAQQEDHSNGAKEIPYYQKIVKRGGREKIVCEIVAKHDFYNCDKQSSNSGRSQKSKNKSEECKDIIGQVI